MNASETGRAQSHTATTGADHLENCRVSATVLNGLLGILFPDATSPDILTVEIVLDRYPNTQLGALAMTAMEQSRRITRARRDFKQMGLFEFHAGLIYLYWGDSRAASPQFAAARTQWSLAGEVPLGCLTHFAQGLALQHSYHLEAAMSQYGAADRCLTRNRAGARAEELVKLDKKLRPLLKKAQEAVQPELWPKEEGLPAPPPGARAAGAPETPGTTEQDAPEPNPPESETEPPSSYQGPPVPPPFSKLGRNPDLERTGPVPGHMPTDTHFAWYVVRHRHDRLLADATEGTWILVDSRADSLAAVTEQQLVVIRSSNSELGSVLVQPQSGARAEHHYYLGYRNQPSTDDEQTAEYPLFLDDSGHALPIPNVLLMGVVVGLWHHVIS